MAKNNIRSVRFSDEMMEIINQQIGDNFTQRFERMVYNCYTLAKLVGDVWDIMTANPVLLVFLCAGLVTLGFSIFRKAKRAARG